MAEASKKFQAIETQIFNDGFEKHAGILKEFFAMVAKDVAKQKCRIGGNFAVAHAVPFREIRDEIRTIIPNCIFIVLTVNYDCQTKRLIKRHGENAKMIEFLMKIHKSYKSPDVGEPNTFEIVIDEEMTENDVFDKVMEVLNSL